MSEQDPFDGAEAEDDAPISDRVDPDQRRSITPPEESGVRLKLDGRWRVLLAHDAATPTCDALIVGLEESLGPVDLFDASSVDDARGLLDAADPHVCFVCLDLPPAPLGGVRLAALALREGYKVVLVTRSLRWLPADASALQRLPWVSPEAGATELTEAVIAALAPEGAPSSQRPSQRHPRPPTSLDEARRRR